MTERLRPAPEAARIVREILADTTHRYAATTVIRQSLTGTQRQYSAGYVRTVKRRLDWLYRQGVIKPVKVRSGARSWRLASHVDLDALTECVSSGMPYSGQVKLPGVGQGSVLHGSQ